MKVIAHRELRNSSAEVLRAVQSGETFEVTNSGKVVAILSPPNDDPLHGLRFRPPLEHGHFSEIPTVVGADSVQAILDDLRDDR